MSNDYLTQAQATPPEKRTKAMREAIRLAARRAAVGRRARREQRQRAKYEKIAGSG